MNFSQKNLKKQKNKPGAGWEDDDDNEQPPVIIPPKKVNEPPNIQNTYVSSNKTQNIKVNTSSENKFEDPSSLGLVLSQRIKFENEFDLLDLSNQENLSKTIEYEIKLVEDLIQPQGAKLKPSENLLIEFGKTCESLQIQTIGSILLTSLKYQENNWKSLLKCLWVIEYLSKKIIGYFRYFKFHSEIIRSIAVIGDSTQTKQIKTVKETLLEFLDHDQNDKNKNIRKSNEINDPLLIRYQQQRIDEKNEMAPITNLLEDSDQDKHKKKNFETEKSNSNFKFISQNKENPKQPKTNSNSIFNLNNQSNGINNSSANNIINSNKSQNNNNIVKINSDLAAINWDIPFENKTTNKTNNTNFNIAENPKNESRMPPPKNPQTSNYNILENLPYNYQNYNYMSQQFSHIQPMYFNTNNSNFDPNLMVSNNLNRQSQVSHLKKEEAKKETAFDFVNDLTQMK